MESLKIEAMATVVEAMASKGNHTAIVRARASAWKGDVEDV